MTPLYSHIIVAAVAFITGIFVYRNNVDLFSPMASKIDERFDDLETKVEKELEKVKDAKRSTRYKRAKSDKS